jgi:DNA polymerase III delta subunit
MADMLAQGIPSFKIYMTYGNRVSDEEIYDILTTAKELEALVCVHCENHGIIQARIKELLSDGSSAPASHPLAHPDQTEAEAIHRLLTMADTTVVLFLCRGECPKNNRLFKALAPENRVVVFEKLTMDRAVNMLIRESALRNVGLDRATAQALIDRVGFDAYRLKNEFSKAAGYVGPGGTVTVAVLGETITPSPEYDAFEMLDALLDGKRKKGYAMLLNALDRGESPLSLAGFLEGRLKLILSAREHLDRGLDPRAAARQLPGSPYAAQIAVKNAQKRTTGSLRQAVADFAAVDGNIKQGIYRDRDALLLAVMNTFEKKEEVRT